MFELRGARSKLSPIKKGWAASAGLLVLVLFHLFSLVPFQSFLRTFNFDLYQLVMPRERLSAPVVIVDIDEESLSRYGQWPWPRSLMARLITEIGVYNPAAIGIDVIMPEPDRSTPCQSLRLLPSAPESLLESVCALPSNDELLAQTLAAYPTVLGVAGIPGNAPKAMPLTPVRIKGGDALPWVRQFPSALRNLPALEAAVSGHAILSADMDRGVIRRVPMVAAVGGNILPSLSLESLRLAAGSPFFDVSVDEWGISGVGFGDLVIPTEPDGSMWVHYSQHEPDRFVSAARVLMGAISPGELERRLVLIGFTGLGLVDFPTTSLGERVPGVEIHAQVLESIFDGKVLQRPYWARWVEAGIMTVLGLVVLYLLPRLKAWMHIPIVAGLVMLLAGGGLLVYSKYLLLLDVASPYVLFVVLYIAMMADSLLREERQIDTLEEDLRAQREEAARVRGEMEAAKRFQMGIVPNAISVFADEPRIDLDAFMEPAKMVGGDLYDCFMLDEHRVFFVLGDVCGKGVPASLFMVISKTLCKSVMLRDGLENLDLGELVSRANVEISRDNPEMLFVTAFLGVLDLRTGELLYCNAGHERPLLVAERCRSLELDAASGPPIAIVDEFEYSTHRHRLSSQEYLCIFSDGVTEAANKDQQLFGKERLLDVLQGVNRDDCSTSMLERVKQGIYRFVGDAEPSDDLTVMVVRWKGEVSN